MASNGTTLARGAEHPERLPEMKRVFADEAEPAADQVAA